MKFPGIPYSLLFFAAACSPTPTSLKSGPIDFDRLVDEQISQLSQRKNTLEKEAEVDGHRSDSTLVPTPETWRAELAIFRQLGIVNKPLHQGSYHEEGPLDDSRSNLKIRQYVSESSPLTLLRIYYQEKIERVRKIEGRVTETNQLYSNQRNLTMEFDEEDGKPVLTHYRISGYQKVALRDTVRFSVEARINW